MEVKELDFREMAPEDADAVEVVEKACFSIPWSRDSFWKEAANENTLYLLALDGERVIGYAGCWISFEECQITNVAILPEYRGQGIGTKLFGAIIEAVKAKGVTAMTLEVRPSNAPARALYARYGFKDAGRRPHYYQDDGEDAIIMWNTKL
ncbi:ribosomal-protein-alanine N-acetyltransferase [Selenomonas caprae]|uniref:[Ribosomal protein bS18]-alanine N-acetyltransferase n=2 Tax=Selenomonas TaxID=970 RepID=A0A1I3FV35_SELRU|nr:MULTISPECIES: ribosomal protein S18-alanine N-acetyltransferase [Selenomonas]MBQ1889913.1 ribosomal protein S18-alanine N-acetyltransferase [Selenomonas sp.]TYZ28303.1 ribosomal-protein-alanine N-acetyltransferase [Selenomonas caprae]SFI14791.1 ribosomal-protein-alanine N-acetyltransferase [Selenomonas ruminantium]